MVGKRSKRKKSCRPSNSLVFEVRLNNVIQILKKVPDMPDEYLEIFEKTDWTSVEIDVIVEFMEYLEVAREEIDGILYVFEKI